MRPGFTGPVFLAGILGIPASEAHAQGITDLLGGRASPAAERKSPARPADLAVGRDRVDLRLGADVIPSLPGRPRGAGEVGISANLELDFICGRFDLRGTFQNLLGREAREEFLKGVLGMLESEVTGSAMELICQAQPTLCTLLQNHNIAANLKLGYHYDRCAAIEQAVDQAQRRLYAGAIEACLREKQAAGVPLDQAIDACRRVERVRGFGGEAVAEFDLAGEIRKFVGFSEGAERLLGGIAEETKYGGSWVSARPSPDYFEKEHEAARALYRDRWAEALERVDRGAGVGPDLRRGLAPPGAPPVTEEEVARLGALPPQERAAAVGSLASAAALLQMTRQIHEVERALEAVAGVPSIEEAQRKLLEGRLGRLRKERERLEELYASQEFYNRAYLAVKNLSDGEYEARRGRARAKVEMEAKKRWMMTRTAPWGVVPARGGGSGSPSAAGLGSGSCGSCGFEYQVGAVGGGGTR